MSRDQHAEQQHTLLRDNEIQAELSVPAVPSHTEQGQVLHRLQTVGEDFWQQLLFCKQLESGDPLFGEGFGRYL